MVGEFVTHLDPTRASPFKMNRPERDSLDGFLGRHPNIVSRRTEQISRDRNAMKQRFGATGMDPLRCRSHNQARTDIKL